MTKGGSMWHWGLGAEEACPCSCALRYPSSGCEEKGGVGRRRPNHKPMRCDGSQCRSGHRSLCQPWHQRVSPQSSCPLQCSSLKLRGLMLDECPCPREVGWLWQVSREKQKDSHELKTCKTCVGSSKGASAAQKFWAIVVIWERNSLEEKVQEKCVSSFYKLKEKRKPNLLCPMTSCATGLKLSQRIFQSLAFQREMVAPKNDGGRDNKMSKIQ